jgi:DNA-binding IclR family transcriptional regulator
VTVVREEEGVDALPAGIDKTVVKSLGMLERLVDLGRPMGVTELALATRLQKSNVHRILATLRHLGYVRSNPDSSYEPTLRVWELGQRIHARMDLPAAARPHLKRLVQETDETSHLAVLAGHEVVYVETIETANPVRAHTPLGGRAPAYCTASGKALLSGQPAAVVRDGRPAERAPHPVDAGEARRPRAGAAAGEGTRLRDQRRRVPAQRRRHRRAGAEPAGRGDRRGRHRRAPRPAAAVADPPARAGVDRRRP